MVTPEQPTLPEYSEAPRRKTWTRRDVRMLPFGAMATGMCSTVCGLSLKLSEARLRWAIWGTAGLTVSSGLLCWRAGPGSVPWDWGFHATEADRSRRKRYCKMCCCWKPERTHHCSICNTCGLNMDHHCPWLMTCVGFHNRKYYFQCISFMSLGLVQLGGASLARIIRDASDDLAGVSLQATTTAASLLLLASPKGIPELTSLSAGLVCLSTGFFRLAKFIFPSRPSPARPLLPWLGLTVAGTLGAGLIRFCRFHWRLAFNNITTIENLELEKGEISKYDIGWRANLEQIFGPVLLLWWLPLPIPSLAPVGNALSFPKRKVLEATIPGHDHQPKKKKTQQQIVELASWMRIWMPVDEDDRRDSLLAELFDLHDLDGSGTIEKSELKTVNQHIHFLHHGPASVDDKKALSKQSSKVFGTIDKNWDGHVDRSEFLDYYEKFLNEIDPDLHAQCWILEQFVEEVRSARMLEAMGEAPGASATSIQSEVQ